MPRIFSLLLAACAAIAGCDTTAPPAAGAAEDASELLRQGILLAEQRKSAQAVQVLSRAIELQPDLAHAYYYRGREHFRLGEIAASVADFEKLVQLAPQREQSLWELGISYYYAGRYGKGTRQFDLYQTYHNRDVENAVWRYLCMAAQAGVEKAREELLPIAGDPRTPMMEIYALYQGRAAPEEVLAAARRGDPPPDALRERLFYAHLYIGLFHEAAGRRAQARPHLEKAAGEYRIGHYMGDVAAVHLRLANADSALRK